MGGVFTAPTHGTNKQCQQQGARASRGRTSRGYAQAALDLQGGQVLEVLELQERLFGPLDDGPIHVWRRAGRVEWRMGM